MEKTIEKKRIYYCTGCKAELRKGENPCPNCGATLIWDGIKEEQSTEKDDIDEET